MLVDCGLNLSAPAFAERHAVVLQEATRQHVTRFVLIGTSEQSSQEALALAEQYPGCIATAGIHPHDAANVSPGYLDVLRTLAADSRVRAIGECGLDYNRNYSPPAIQRRIFAAQLALAAELKLPVYLHERDALDDQLAILDEFRRDIPALFTHCFTGDRAALEQYIERDCYIGVTGWVCDERRGADLQAALPSIPDARLLLETDAPYLLPRTIRPRPKSRTNVPGYLPYVLETVADLRKTDVKTLMSVTTENAQRLFGSWSAMPIPENSEQAHG